jgi:hypothetical protein
MGDHTTETLEQLQRRDDERSSDADRFLGVRSLYLHEGSIFQILNHIDCFVSQSRGNESVKKVVLDPYALYGQGDEVWDKVGQAIGNLQALKTLRISTDTTCYVADDEKPDWGELTRILSHMRQMVDLDLYNPNSWGPLPLLQNSVDRRRRQTRGQDSQEILRIGKSSRD